MGKSRWIALGISAFALLVAPARYAAADSIVVPGASETTEGDSSTSSPLAGGTLQSLLLIDASEFGDAPLLLTSLALRPDGPAGQAFAGYVRPSIRLSTTTATGASLSPVFADHRGNSEVTVLSPNASYGISSSWMGPTGGPKAFDVVLEFTTPYLYDPSEGNLLVDIRNVELIGGFTGYDAVHSPSLTMVRAHTSQLSGVKTEGFGYVVAFNVEAVPEPATGVLVAASLLTGVLTRRRRKSAN